MVKKIWQPIVNCGFLSGEFPLCFEASFIGFETESECDQWIENSKERFTQEELAGGVYPQEFEVEDPTIIDANENVLNIYE